MEHINVKATVFMYGEGGANSTVIPYHYANTPMKYTAIFHGCKNVNFQVNFFNSFLIFAQNIDSGYTLEPPRRF